MTPLTRNAQNRSVRGHGKRRSGRRGRGRRKGERLLSSRAEETVWNDLVVMAAQHLNVRNATEYFKMVTIDFTMCAFYHNKPLQIAFTYSGESDSPQSEASTPQVMRIRSYGRAGEGAGVGTTRWKRLGAW